ncbi:hypothetical protein GOP47_0005566 [Adiantum capillus-veneris]|uniref:Uncharacterized protein n=1 Tax=Adiantum capillus-veneris TaxID=13818 RepID=A0A9D4V612_ADICA|nr:hypothetical protein GOP47_0005566 [Adiantum capillus-veneris]
MLLQQGAYARPNFIQAENLKADHIWLLDLLLRFKRPNAKSRSALDVAQVVIGDHKMDINSELKNMSLDISKQLLLDEVQSYILVSRSFTDDEPPFSNAESFQKVYLKYFTERQCLLKCVRLLLLSQTAEPTYSEALEMEVTSLVKGGLEDKLMAVLEMLLTAEQPLDMDMMYINLWAEQVIREEHLVLDALFLMYFKPICSCSFTRWKELFIMFKERVFVGTNAERLSVTAEALTLTEHVKHQCLLIMLEGLDLDKLLLMVHEDVPFSHYRHPFAVSDLQQIDGLLGELNASEVQDYAPLLLGWGIFGCLVSFLPMSDTGALDLNHTFYTHQAYEAGAFKYIHDMLCHKVMQETLIDGYKCVIKSVASTFVAAYDIMSQNDTGAIDNVIGIVNLVHSAQEMLCTEFWDRENILDGPLRNLLYSLRQIFPYKMKTFVQFLSGLAEGTWPAQCVYDFLYKPSEISCVYGGANNVEDSNQQVIANMDVPIPEVSGLFIPAGTAGQCLKMLDDQKRLVLWKCEHSAIVLLLLHLVELIEAGNSWGEVHAIINLLHHMICSNKMIAEAFLKLDKSDFCRDARSDGRMGVTVSIDMLVVLRLLLDKLLDLSDHNATASLCTNLFGVFAECCPQKVMSELQKPLSVWSCNTMDDGLFMKLLSNICEDSERSMGKHLLVISVLDLCMLMVKKGVYTEGLHKMVIHMIGTLSLNHVTWKYEQKHERWKITAKVFELTHMVISNFHPNFSQLKGKVLDFIINDGAFHSVLIRVLSVSMADIQGLYFNRFVEPLEIEWFEAAVTQGLLLLHQGLSIFLACCLVDESRSSTPLEHVLLHHTAGTMPFVGCVASLIGYFQNQAMQLASLKMLMTLCVVAGKALPHAVIISSYIQGVEQKQNLQTLMGKLLSKEAVESNTELFVYAMELLITSTAYQPSFVNMLLLPIKGGDGSDAQAHGNLVPCATQNTQSGSTAIESMWMILSQEHGFFESQPKILSRLLLFLRSLWGGGTELSDIMEVFQKRVGFWSILTSCISNTPSVFHGLEEFPARCFQYQCQTYALQIMAWELFLEREQIFQTKDTVKGVPTIDHVKQENSQETKSGVFFAMAQILQASDPTKLVQSFAVPHYDKEVALRAKAETRVLLVGLMLKLVMEEELGFSAVMCEFLQESLKAVFSHLSFQKLLSTYLSQGYGRCGRELYMLVISDLYFHLHGELEAGRHIPAGLFEDLVELLDTLDVTAIVRSKKQTFNEEVSCKNAFVYDTEVISQHLGLEWWSENSSQVAQTAKSTLKAMEQANMMTFLGSSQISALEALTSIFSFLVSDIQLVVSGLKFSAKFAFVVEVCSSIEFTIEVLGPEGDPTQFMQSFILAQLTLLLVLLQWILNSGREGTANNHVERLCSKVLSTLARAVKPVSSSCVAQDTMKKQLIRSLLGAYLSSLELLHAQNDRKILKCSTSKLSSDYESSLVSDITTLSAEILPYLCSFVESKCHASLAISVICILIKRFLAPHTWLPVLQMQSTISHALSLLHTTEDTEGAFQVLNLLLSLSHVRSGVEMLQSASAFSHILRFTEKLKEEFSHGEVHGPFSVWKRRTRRHELWGLSAAIVAAFVQALGENTGDRAIEVAFAFLDSQKEQMLHALQSPGCSSTENGNMTRYVNSATTVSALQETHQVLHLLVVLVRYHARWAQVMGASEGILRHKCIHLLAYIAREGLVRNSSSIGKASFCCYPTTKEEVRLQRLSSPLKTMGGWFGLAAKGVCMTSRFSVFETNSQASLSLLPKMSYAQSQVDSVLPTIYSDSIAVYVYRISLLLLEVLCRQAHHIVMVMSEGAAHNYNIFPEFPAPEVLHGLQDQVMSILRDIYGRGSTTPINKEAEEACRVLFLVLEKALILETFVTRICGLGPLSLRAEDFLRDYKDLLGVCAGHKLLDGSLKSLKPVVSLAFPSVS